MKESETPKVISDAETTTLPPAEAARPATERNPGRGFLARIGVVLPLRYSCGTRLKFCSSSSPESYSPFSYAA